MDTFNLFARIRRVISGDELDDLVPVWILSSLGDIMYGIIVVHVVLSISHTLAPCSLCYMSGFWYFTRKDD